MIQTAMIKLPAIQFARRPCETSASARATIPREPSADVQLPTCFRRRSHQWGHGPFPRGVSPPACVRDDSSSALFQPPMGHAFWRQCAIRCPTYVISMLDSTLSAGGRIVKPLHPSLPVTEPHAPCAGCRILVDFETEDEVRGVMAFAHPPTTRPGRPAFPWRPAEVIDAMGISRHPPHGRG